MSTENGLRIGSCLLAIVLLGASAMQTSFAEEARSGAHDSNGSYLSTEGSRPPSGEDVDRSATKFENHAAPESGDASKSDGNAAAKQQSSTIPQGGLNPVGKEFEGIDTRITMQSRRPGGRQDKVRDVKPQVRLLASSKLHQRKLAFPRTSDRALRNAIGLPVAGHGSVQLHDGEHHDFPALVQRPAAGAVGIAGSATGGLAKAEGGLDRPTILHPGASLIVGPALNRGTINGTSLVRPGVGLPGVGGPAKVVAGISGTTIRPKH